MPYLFVGNIKLYIYTFDRSQINLTKIYYYVFLRGGTVTVFLYESTLDLKTIFSAIFPNSIFYALTAGNYIRVIYNIITCVRLVEI